MTGPQPAPRPLEGVLVVSCEQAVAAPLATRHLADLGARVIKIERPGRGDFARDYDTTVNGLSSHFVWLNRSKESVVADLKDPAGADAVRALVARADVFVQNLAPGAAERLGLSSAELRREHPRLITCDVSGYGSSGPYRDAKAYDLLVQSETGLVTVTGTEEHPAKAGIPAADIGAGMYAFSGILTALFARERTGEGAALEVSLFDALTEWMGFPLHYAAGSGQAPTRQGTSHSAIAPYGSFAAADGSEVVLAVQNEREWERFCDVVLDDAALATDPRFATGADRVAHRGELQEAIDRVLGTRSGDEVVAALVEAGIAHARRRELAEVLTHPQHVERDRIVEVDSPAGPFRAFLPPVSMSDVTPRMDPVPDVGEHTDAVLEEFGVRGT